MIRKIAKNHKTQQLIKQRPVFPVVPQILQKKKILETHSFVIILSHSNITIEHAQFVTTKKYPTTGNYVYVGHCWKS